MRVSALLFLSLLTLSCDSVDPCDAAAIADRLAAAQPGDVVNIGSCTVPGGLTVPAGVTLEGVGSTVSAIDALPGNLVAIDVDTAPDLVTVVRGLSVLGRGIAIEVRGNGGVLLEDLNIDAESGTGVSVTGALSAELRQITVQGPITSDNATESEWIDVTDSIGLAMNGVAEVSLRDVQVRGMAWAGVVAENSGVQATRLSVQDTLGYGVVLFSGSGEFAELEITDTYQGLRGEPSLAFAAQDATWSTSGFVLERSERYGIVSQGGTASIDDLAAHTGGDAALWVGGASSLRLGGENSIEEMRFAGAVVVDSQSVDIRNLNVSNIDLATRNIGAGDLFAMLELGDGLHLVGDLSGARFENVDVSGAARAGLILELGEGDAPTFSGVSIDAPAGTLGAVAGRAAGMPFELDFTPEDAWDEGITRDADSELGDAMFSGALGVARTQSPATVPL